MLSDWATETFTYWKTEYSDLLNAGEVTNYQKQGYWVVYDSEEVCCPETDATLGYATAILKKPDGSPAVFLNQYEAQEFAKANKGFIANPTAPHRPGPMVNPRKGDHLELFKRLKAKGGNPKDWARLALLDREVFTEPQFKVAPYRDSWTIDF